MVDIRTERDLSPVTVITCGWMGNGVCGQFIMHGFCHTFLLKERTSHTLSLNQHWSLSWETFLHEFSNRSPSQQLHFFTNCSNMSTLWGHKFCQHGTYFSMGSFLHEVSGPARSFLHHGLSTGSQPPLGTSTCSGVVGPPETGGGDLLHC